MSHEGRLEPSRQAGADPLYLSLLDPRSALQRSRDQANGKPPKRAQILARYRNALELEDLDLVRSRGKGGLQQVALQQQRIRDYLDGDCGVRDLPAGAELRMMGQQLFENLLPGRIRRLYDYARRTQDGRRLDIILTSMFHHLADLPWEFAFDMVQSHFLAIAEVNFLRNVFAATPAEETPPTVGPLRILVIAAQPIGWKKLSSEAEISLLRSGFRELEEEGLAEVVALRCATAQSFHERIQHAEVIGEHFHVLHFIGHGEYDEQRQVGYLVFESRTGGASRIDTDQMRLLVCRRGFRLVFLNACETGTGGQTDFNRGVAQGLVAGGVPTVVANQYKVLDSTATNFAGHFYWLLALGKTIGDAAREARIAVSLAISGDTIDWAVPVVFTQNPRERLGRVQHRPFTSVAIRQLDSSAPNSLRRAGRIAASQIGLWDVNTALPQLVEVASRLNEVQSEFFLKPVTLTAAVGTWRLERSEQGSLQGFVSAEHVVRSLKDQPASLGLRKLFCFTTFPLADEVLLKLYRAEVDPADRIAVFSLAGFEEPLGTPGLPIERAITNLVVGSLTGIAWHPTGTTNCPHYFNGERDPRWVAGPLAFCPKCSSNLDRLVNDSRLTRGEVKALEAMLAT